MSTINPFIGNATVKVNTPVISMVMKRCTTTTRRRRRRQTVSSLVGLSDGSNTLVNINIPPTTLGLWVNATPKVENDGMAFSEFNLTAPGSVPLVVRITASAPSTVHAFIRRHTIPTTSNYDWMLTTWNSTAANDTLYISAELTKDVNTIYIGVRSIAGNNTTLLLDRVALVAYSRQTFPWTICRSVCLSVQCIVEKRRIGSGCRLAS